MTGQDLDPDVPDDGPRPPATGHGHRTPASRSRRASRAAGPVTPGTDQLLGTWTRADDATEPAPPVPDTDGAPTAPPPSPEHVETVRPAADGPQTNDRPGGAARRRRRVTTQPVPGSDPAPAPEPPRHRAGENDDQLRRDVPPHW